MQRPLDQSLAKKRLAYMAEPLIMQGCQAQIAFQPKIAPETISGGLKCKIFPGGECPQTPLAGTLRALNYTKNNCMQQ